MGGRQGGERWVAGREEGGGRQAGRREVGSREGGVEVALQTTLQATR